MCVCVHTPILFTQTHRQNPATQISGVCDLERKVPSSSSGLTLIFTKWGERERERNRLRDLSKFTYKLVSGDSHPVLWAQVSSVASMLQHYNQDFTVWFSGTFAALFSTRHPAATSLIIPHLCIWVLTVLSKVPSASIQSEVQLKIYSYGYTWPWTQALLSNRSKMWPRMSF